MAIQKRHRGTLGDFSGMGAPDLSFNEPESPKAAEPQPAPVEEAPVPKAEPVVAGQPVAAPEPVKVEAQIPATAEVESAPAEEAEKPRRGRPKGIKGAGPKRLNLIQGDKDKVLALQLPSKLIDGLRRYADDHDITMKELIGKTLMKKIGPEYYK
ncbi:MAG: hypothetical protein MJZ73_11075 [Bacteroidaceae bacterium]|nr:hypothetical protein [Bacteroidaceae bacterium]